MMARSVALFALTLLALPAMAAAALEGRVRTASGTPIDHARVEALDSGDSTLTDSRGHFAFAEVDPPAEVRITHPRFYPTTVVMTGPGELAIVLEVKQEVFEEIVISANRGGASFSPVSVAANSSDPLEAPVFPSTVTELVSEVPGVSENGQGGLLQNYSIRGVSRQRVLTLIAGMRIETDRRAGVSASFLEPYLIETAEVLRGPSSTYYGSGALGGVVQLLPRRFDGWGAQVGYAGQGGENWQAMSWGDETWSLGVARRAAGKAETPAGEELNSAFDQLSGSARGSWSSGSLTYDLLVLGSAGRDIGKANTDYPQRATTYPEENHLLVRFALSNADRWRLEGFVHPNDLETEVVRAGERRNEVFNDASDLGLSWSGLRQVGESGSARFGVDYFGRRSVDSREVETELDAGAAGASRQTLEGGAEDQLGAYGALELGWGRASLLAGARSTWQRQENAASGATSNAALSGFLGLVAPLGAGFEVVANAGSGLRFPTLSERFFSGTTGRGEVVGNPLLERERSFNLELGMRWFGQRLFVAGYLFHNRIDDYIERVEIAEGLLTFVNLTSGRIAGFEIEGHYQIDPKWNVSFGGHRLDGEDDRDLPLADIPADRLFLGAGYIDDHWSGRLRWELRAAKDEAGSGEKAIPSADIVTASIGHRWESGLGVRLEARNLLDEEYFNSADEQVPLAPGRSLGLTAIWSQR